MRGVCRKKKGVEGSTSSIVASHAKFGPESSSSPTLGDLRAQAQVEEYHKMVDSMGDSLWHFVANLQSQMPHL